MNIKWNEYRWYSKWASLVFFILILPILTFYIGTQYESAKLSLENRGNETSAVRLNILTSTNSLAASSIVSGKNLYPQEENMCKENSKYVVVTRNAINGDVGSDILVKYKSNYSSEPNCDYVVSTNDYEIKNGSLKNPSHTYPYSAQYFLTIEGDYLLLDNGTAPPPRDLLLINLKERNLAGGYSYSHPIDVENNTVTFWTSTDTKDSKSVCTAEDSKSGEGTGGGVEASAQVSLDLATMKVNELGKYRCQILQ